MKIVEKAGLKFFCRPGPGWDDEYCVDEVIERNVYEIEPDDIRDKIVVDIGANIGTFSLFASKYAKKVYSYEPGPTNFDMLKMNIALNKITNIEAFNVAVGKPGEDTIEPDSSGHSRIGSAGGLNGVPVKVIGFDEIPTDEIYLLKMDCEGGEYDVVKYASDEKLKKVNKILGELHSWIFESEEYQEEHKRMIEKLEKHFTMRYTGFKNSVFWGIKRDEYQGIR